MKYAVLLGDGMADWAVESLGGKTPLEYARIPNMDRIAREGTLGLIDTVPKGMKPGSDVAILSVLGYDPAACYTGRGPLEAASMGVRLDPGDLAFRCNLVSLGDGSDPVMEDFTAGHIPSDEAREVIEDLDRRIGSERLKFHPGVATGTCSSGKAEARWWRPPRPTTSRVSPRPDTCRRAKAQTRWSR